MKKQSIGILDMGMEGLTIVEKLASRYPNEKFLYLNDLGYYPYEAYKKEEVLGFVEKNIDYLLKKNIKFIIVVSDSIFEICHENLKDQGIEIIFLVPSLIQYINTKYPYKSILLLARKSIVEANLYQKFLKYSQLLSSQSDDLEKIINSGNIKVMETFEEVEKISQLMLKREIDLVLPSAPFIIKLKTEFLEFFPNSLLIDAGEAICETIKQKLSGERTRGGIVVFSKLTKKEFKEKTKWFNIKYKYKQIEEESNESSLSIEKIIEKNIKE